MNSRHVVGVLALLLALGIFAISALPTETKHAMHIQGALHPWVHLLSFGLLAGLFMRSTRNLAVRCLLIAALLGFAYLTEARESHKDGWPIEKGDVQTDALGVAGGSVLGLLLTSRHPRKP